MPATAARTIFSSYAPAALNDASVPPFPGHEADEEEEGRGLDLNLDVEVAQASWRCIAPGTAPADAPVRFIDGSIKSKTVGCIIVGGRRRPLIAAAVSAAALEIEGRGRSAGRVRARRRCWPCTATASSATTGCEAFHALARDRRRAADQRGRGAPGGGRLRHAAADDAQHRHAGDGRGGARRHAGGHPEPTLMDGLLERRLATQKLDLPVVGLVKRQMTTYLPSALQELVVRAAAGRAHAGLRAGHAAARRAGEHLRAAVVAEGRIAVVRHRAGDGAAGVRDQAHAPDLPAYLSGLAGYLYALRHRDQATRAAASASSRSCGARTTCTRSCRTSSADPEAAPHVPGTRQRMHEEGG